MIQSLNKVADHHDGTPLAVQARRIGQRLTNQLNQLIDRVGFQEYYLPTQPIEHQKQIGFGTFSWTAAIFLLNNAREILQERNRAN